MSADLLRRAAEQARAMAESQRVVAPALAALYDGDDCDALAAAQRHDAVADWLDALADFPTIEVEPEHADRILASITAGLLVAHAYLGEPLPAEPSREQRVEAAEDRAEQVSFEVARERRHG
jgi:hypothetical protein